jgi:hypothetical protein
MFGSLFESACIITKAQAVSKANLRGVTVHTADNSLADSRMRRLTFILLCLVQALAQGLPPLAAAAVLDVGRASAADEAQTNAVPSVVINEIHYDPRFKNANLEYVELTNAGSAGVDLTGWSLGPGVDFVFPPGAQLPPGGYLVVARAPDAVRRAYGANAIGPFAGRLSNDGDNLVLRDRGGQVVDEVDYAIGFPWPTPNDDVDHAIGLTNATLDNALGGAWRSGAPTPGQPNSLLFGNAPPIVTAVSHAPLAPRSTDTVTISARVTDADGIASVRLWLQRVIPGEYIRLTDPQYQTDWVSIPMQPAGGDLYVAQTPPDMRVNRMLVRYRVEAVDSGNRSVMTPFADDPQPNFAYFVYDGPPPWRGAINPRGQGSAKWVLTYDFGQMRPLPVYNLLARQSDIEDSQFIPNSTLPGGYMGSDYPWLGTLVVNGAVYDHIGFRARGGEYRYSAGKNHWKFDFTRGHGFQAYDDYGKPYAVKWDKMNFSAVLQHAQRHFRGEQGMFESLAYRLFNLAGVPASHTHFVHFRVVDHWDQETSSQYVGDFWGLYLAIENMDGQFLEEHDLPDGNLYDMSNWTGELDNLGHQGVGDKSDLNGFMNGYTWGSPDANWWRNVFDLDGYYRFRAILEAVHHYDVHQGKNYYYYLNPTTNQWSILPWDLDLTWSEEMFGLGAEPFRDRVLTIPEFNVDYQNELRAIRDLLFNPEQMFPLIDETAAMINTPAQGFSMVDADRALWDFNPILVSRYVSDDRAMNGKFYEISPDHAFTGMVQLLKDYVARRSAWIDQALLTDRALPDTPALSYVGPAGYPADQLRVRASGFRDPQGSDTFAAIQWRAAEIVRPGLPGYTENSRWRYEVEATWLSPVLTTYTDETPVPNSACRPGVLCRVRVRMLDTSGRWSHWSAPVEFVAGSPTLGPNPALQVSELMYKPGSNDALPSQELEFIELTNTGAAPVDLSGMRFAEGIEYRFPTGVWLQPGAHVVLANHAAYFQEYYGIAPFGQYDKDLSNGGERIVLLNAYGAPAIDFAYSDEGGWPQAADGQGASLVAVGNNPNDPSAWRASTTIGGSPGAPDPAPVLVNEVELDRATGSVVKVELFNPSSYRADIGGWQLTSTAVRARRTRTAQSVPQSMRLANGTRVEPNGYLVLDVSPGSVVLDSGDTAVTLLAAEPDGRLSGYIHRANLALPLTPATVGRYVTSDGREHFVAQTAPSWGGPNAGPQAPRVVISALSVNPADGVQWFEVTNNSTAPAKLYNPGNLQQNWLVAGVAYPLAPGVELPPGGRMVVTAADPADLCLSGSIPSGLRVLGPLPLPLTGQGMDLALLQPVAWGMSGAFAQLDGVSYRSTAPWPPQVTGVVLTRIDPAGFGDEPRNWQASSVTGSGGLAALTPGTLAPNAPADLCSFDAFINAKGQLEVRWVAEPLSGTVGFRLLRSPIDDLSTRVLVATYPAGNIAETSVPDHVQVVDAQADPQKKYIYWLQGVTADDSVREVAMTTVRPNVTFAFAPYVAP